MPTGTSDSVWPTIRRAFHGEGPRRPPARPVPALLAILVCLIMMSGCTTVLTRAPAPEAGLDEARPYSIEGDLIRAWGDSLDTALAEALIKGRIAMLRDILPDRRGTLTTIDSPMLTLSGGGSEGAIGAGLLAGWAERGDRPTRLHHSERCLRGRDHRALRLSRT